MAVLKHYSYNGNEISITPTVVILEAKDGGALAYWDRTEFSSLEEYVVKSNSAPRKIREKLAVCYKVYGNMIEIYDQYGAVDFRFKNERIVNCYDKDGWIICVIDFG